ncbi:MAG: 30S ribosomal protein S4 [Oscillospiraceae bacterium]|jgi:small subunit ribosomal protein S4|nr:30S ribosomal protein S4 [Oscillospiraceae bacterium]
MAVNHDPILKKCRNLGISPGVLGYSKETKRDPKRNARRSKSSEYALQLKEKQKAKFIYGVLERQFRTTFEKAEKMQGQSGENLLILLERRLDNVAFVMGFGETRRQARQLVGHGHILVNGRRVNIPSYRVKPGDTVSVKSKSRQSELFKTFAENPKGLPSWITGSTASFEGKIERMPVREDIDVPVNETLIVELYSK